ncbi:MAG: L-2-hydroxyglutarate oxidase [Oligoflexia bacterium]|nr:L-2-hydroxyglutarate oxidase [Oligoflexia bacterium]
MRSERIEYLIAGAGIVGMALALRLIERNPGSRIVVIDKESEVAKHASGRNSGVLHSGIYYVAESLKAKFTMAGNRALREFCAQRGIRVNQCGKLIVATNAAELEKLFELEKRGKANGATVELLSASDAERIDPNVRTYQHALWSPLTATVSPSEVALAFKAELEKRGVAVQLNERFLAYREGEVLTSLRSYRVDRFINAAGLGADRIARECGFGKEYTIIPFKGIYLKYDKNETDIRTNIYPVPDLKKPFLEVHFTKTVDGHIKIGPTAIPALWRENYRGLSGFNLLEMLGILSWEAKLFLWNSFGFRDLAFTELRKYDRRFLIRSAAKLVKHLDPQGFGEFTTPGIRAQLLNRSSNLLVQDFVVQADRHSVHILNAVSPGFTCSLPFAEYVIDKYL